VETKKDGTVTETLKQTDGSTTTVETKKDGSKTETVEKADGSSTTKQTDTAGTVTETAKTADGVTGTTVTDSTGTVTEISASVPAEAVTTEKAVTLPVTVTAAKTSTEATVVSISTAQETKVEIPVADVTSGIVAVLVKEDGTEEIIKTSGISEDGVVVTLDGDTQIKLIDNTKTFSDVSGGWYGDAVNFVSAREIMVGDAGSFQPNQNLNRAMMAQLLFNLDSGEAEGTDAGFVDVGDNWYTDAVNWAAESGIVEGYGDGSFGPTDNITREQMAVFLYRYAKAKGYDVSQRADMTGFTDSASASDWAEEAMSWAVATGLIEGMDDTTLSPDGQATRAQVATILMRFCSKVA
jgi:hypothetical protein